MRRRNDRSYFGVSSGEYERAQSPNPRLNQPANEIARDLFAARKSLTENPLHLGESRAAVVSVSLATEIMANFLKTPVICSRLQCR